jgi:hypothetical protein
MACMSGAPITTGNDNCASPSEGGIWYPDLRRDEQLIDVDLMVKF